VCGNVTPQPSVNSIAESATVMCLHTFTLPVFHDSSKDSVMHFLRDLHEYYRIKKKVPESPKLPLTMPAVADPIVEIGSVSCTVS